MAFPVTMQVFIEIIEENNNVLSSLSIQYITDYNKMRR